MNLFLRAILSQLILPTKTTILTAISARMRLMPISHIPVIIPLPDLIQLFMLMAKHHYTVLQLISI